MKYLLRFAREGAGSRRADVALVPVGAVRRRRGLGLRPPQPEDVERALELYRDPDQLLYGIPAGGARCRSRPPTSRTG